MGGWWGDYSFRCQPVDHSTSGRAMRVSLLFEEPTKIKLVLTLNIQYSITISSFNKGKIRPSN